MSTTEHLVYVNTRALFMSTTEHFMNVNTSLVFIWFSIILQLRFASLLLFVSFVYLMSSSESSNCRTVFAYCGINVNIDPKQKKSR